MLWLSFAVNLALRPGNQFIPASQFPVSSFPDSKDTKLVRPRAIRHKLCAARLLPTHEIKQAMPIAVGPSLVGLAPRISND